MFASRKRFTGAVALAVVAGGLSLLPLAPAQADVSGKISAFPYSQPWSDANLITVNDDWSGVLGVQGYLGEDLTTVTGADPQTITADGAGTSTDVIANGATSSSSGGVLEAAAEESIALQGSGTADVPHVVVHLDLSALSAATFAFDAKDLDGSGDNAAQSVAVQYRVGPSGAYTNLPAGYVADATEANAATKVTPVSVPLPAGAVGQADVYVRVLTTNAVGNDEWVGIDNIAVTEAAPPLTATDPGATSGIVDIPLTSFVLAATGGSAPYTWEATGLPPGVSIGTDGEISGTPTTAGDYEVTATVTDDDDATDSVTFDLTITDKDVRTIAEVQGTGASSTFVGSTVTVEGVVTGMYADPYPGSGPADLGTYGGLDGMYIQTPGDDTDGASDAIFVYGDHAMPADVEVGDSVEVTGAVSEFKGSTDTLSLTEITAVANGVSVIAPLGSVSPRTIDYPTTDAGREAHEGELLAPTDDFTVTNSYSTNQFGEIGLATGDSPLKQPTEFVLDDDAAGIAEIKAENAERSVVLDDGTSINYLSNGTPQQDLPLPWLTPTNAVRVGASVTFEQPVILDYRNNTWKFQPSEPVLDDGTDVATFQDTRALNETPQDVGGDLKIATFNVLNYFNTTGEQYVARGAAQSPPVTTACTYYTDRDNNRIGNNTCGVVTNGVNAGNRPRGAATEVSYERQRDKIVTAINTLGADIVGLEEIENSMKLTGETNRDDAVAALVAALNTATGSATWRYVHSPGEALVAGAVSEQDVIRPAFIYKQAKVEPVGQSDILFGTTEFANAREPLAQAFKPKGAPDSTAFAVIVNHFKSKGDSNPPQSGNDNVNNPDTGAFNGDRTRQATRLAEFAEDFAEERGIDAVFLAGDFNSYTNEDPMQVLYGKGYTAIESSTAGEETYSFGGLSGSLDHVLGNGAAMDMVSGADIWDINAAESVAYQYSRYNYNVTQLFDADNPFAASDHNPEIVGINLDDYSTAYTPIQIVATNDFHGRLLADGTNAAGAAVLSGAVKELRADQPNTAFVAAGDLIGASTFESFIQHDKPTIDALNAAGLDVSSVGNHEFDAGYDDLLNRVMAPYDATTNPEGGAQWKYIASNVRGPAGGPQLAKSWTKDFTLPSGDVTVGFVGAVTEDLPSLVSPGGMNGVTVSDIVDSVNAEAENLKDNEGADLIIMLVHEGAPSTDCTTMTNPSTTWGHIVNDVNDDVDAIVSGHTHLAYNCSFPVDGWAGRDVTQRPVVSAGQYGTNLNKLMFTYDNTTGELVATSQDVVNLTGTGFAPDPAVVPIVASAVTKANELGAVKLGEIGGVFNRAKLVDGTTENRGGESTLGNLVAEVQRWATETPEAGSAQIAFMNPGGLRADMAGNVVGSTRELTYKQAAVVQPFANTLVNMNLTGANLKLVLEQQWQRDGSGNIPTRAFLRLGVSKGFTYTYDPAKPEDSRITGMWLNGVAISPTASYSVTVNSFLATGGDNFRAFTNGTGTRDTGKADLQAMVDYMATFAATSPLPVDYSQRAVGVSFPAGAPASYKPGDHVLFSVSSWAMSTGADTKDTAVTVKLGDQVLGTASLDNAPTTALTDEVGKASVDVVLPAGTPGGAVSLTLVGAQTGTQIPVVVTVDQTGPPEPPVPTVPTVTAGDVSLTYGKSAVVTVNVNPTATGTVQILGAGGKLLGSAAVSGGVAQVTLPARSVEPGSTTLTAAYSGDSQFTSGSDTFVATVAKASSTTKVKDSPAKVKVKKTRVTLKITVSGQSGVVATGKVKVKVPGQGTKTVTLRGGKATLKLGKFTSTGKKTIRIDYLGSDLLKPSDDTVKIKVVKK